MAGLRVSGGGSRAGGAREPLIDLDATPDPALDGRELAASLPFEEARRAVAELARATPLVSVPSLSERLGRRVLAKLENLQRTGSFKVRGAAARLAALSPEERARGIVACSSGNHGRATAWVARRLDVPATIYVPSWVDPVKLEGIRGEGARAVLCGDSFDEAEARAVRHAEEEGRPFISAYDDPWIIAGQGTLATEILEQRSGERPAALLVPLSGGGLAGGMAAALLAGTDDGAPPSPSTQVVAVSAERAAVMFESVRAGRPVQLPEEETLASALAGGIGDPNRWSFRLVRDLVHRHATVTEDEIKDAIRFCYNEMGVVIEGGGAVPLAALRAGRWSLDSTTGDGPVVVVLSGGNLSSETLHAVLAHRS